jgi:hypothetical protein
MQLPLIALYSTLKKNLRKAVKVKTGKAIPLQALRVPAG